LLTLTVSVIETLWPGNIRQLKDVIVRLSAECEGREIAVDDLPDEFKMACADDAIPDDTLGSVIRGHILKTLHNASWNKSLAARMLGLPLSTLVSKMKKLGLSGSRIKVPSSADLRYFESAAKYRDAKVVDK
jgi:transcriptional regulator of acetoin/glycerol metabolism